MLVLNDNSCPQFADQVRRRMAIFANVIDPCNWQKISPAASSNNIGGDSDQIGLMLQLGTLSNMGRMAAGIVHEIRNPLASLRGFLQMLAQEWQGGEVGQEYITIMMEEIDGINQIAGELLQLSKPSVPTQEVCNPGVLIREIASLLKGQALIHDVEVQYALVPAVLPNTIADGKRLKQAVLNLTTNAIQAMPQGGIVMITITYLKDADGYVIEVKDNGPGIDTHLLPHIFTPFFTTKAQGGGLGLYIVDQIIHDHEGSIKVDSRVGGGTTFKIWLPRIISSAAAVNH